MLYRRKPVIVKAEQFNPLIKPWPAGIASWDNEPLRPRDMSWGYILVNGTRTHIRAGDWLVTCSGRVWVVEQGAFDDLYEPLPGAAEALANMKQHPISATGSVIAKAINDTNLIDELAAAIEAGQEVMDNSWHVRMVKQGWEKDVVTGEWATNAHDLLSPMRLYPEVAQRLEQNDITPDELFAVVLPELTAVIGAAADRGEP